MGISKISKLSFSSVRTNRLNFFPNWVRVLKVMKILPIRIRVLKVMKILPIWVRVLKVMKILPIWVRVKANDEHLPYL
jgi:hypothetical protein